MQVHLIDGTYELFRAYYGAPSHRTATGQEVGASRSLLRSFAAFVTLDEVTHVGVAFDTVIESFRNRLFAGYKTGEGIDPLLHAQFPLAERITRALGMVTWSMVEFEADDALATFALRASDDPRVTQVRICSPDKDLCQCVRGERVVLCNRKTSELTNEEGVNRRLGVRPEQVPALLALVGDSADGIPGIARWGMKSAQKVLAVYPTLTEIPDDGSSWQVSVRGAAGLSHELSRARDDAALYQRLATLYTDVPIDEEVDDLSWRGPDWAELTALCDELDAADVLGRLSPTEDASVDH